MADNFQPHRFRSAAAHYLSGRPPYPSRLIRLVAQLASLTDRDRVLDLGCGPGILAGAFAPLAAEVVALDPEPEMLRIARATFGSGRIDFIEGSSFDLAPSLGRFKLVTMGRSFQWMDRADTARRLDGMVEAAGTIALFNTENADVPDNAWMANYRAAVRRYAEGDITHPQRCADWVRHEVVLLESAFSELTGLSVIERRPVSVAQLVDRAFSRSSTAPDRLGADAPRLAAEIEALLHPLAKDGTLTEVVTTTVLLARRP